MKKTVDAKGQPCPKPVIMTKKQLDNEEVNEIITIVDNEVSKENVLKLVKSSGYKFSIEEKGDDYYINIYKGDLVKENTEKTSEENLKDMTIAFSSDKMGKGDEKLGDILINSFIYTVSETKPYPKTLLFYNSGVKLTCKGSKVLDDLKKLEQAGVEIISCGTCLDFLNLNEDLEIGSVSNMYSIYEKLRDPKSNIIIG